MVSDSSQYHDALNPHLFAHREACQANPLGNGAPSAVVSVPGQAVQADGQNPVVPPLHQPTFDVEDGGVHSASGRPRQTDRRPQRNRFRGRAQPQRPGCLRTPPVESWAMLATRKKVGDDRAHAEEQRADAIRNDGSRTAPRRRRGGSAPAGVRPAGHASVCPAVRSPAGRCRS